MTHRSDPRPRRLPLALLLCLAAAAPKAPEATLTPNETLCASNPAFSYSVMRAVLDAQLARDHDPALDEETPEQLAFEAQQKGISDCGRELTRDPAIAAALSGLSGNDLRVGWDAYNTACDDRRGTKAACITAEVGSVRALKRMALNDQPPGARALVQTCELVMQTDPPMAEWRQCVDRALAMHPTPEAAAGCKTAVTWHVAKTGAEAAGIVTQCLGGTRK